VETELLHKPELVFIFIYLFIFVFLGIFNQINAALVVEETYFKSYQSKTVDWLLSTLFNYNNK